MKIFFETNRACEEFRNKQTCITRKYYDTTVSSFYLILTPKFDLLGRQIKPNLRILDSTSELYSRYCNIVNELQSLERLDFISSFEKEQLKNFVKSFTKFTDETRQEYEIDNNVMENEKKGGSK